MKITSLDIRRKEFKRSVRGYADEEVDLFLDEVADELERLAAESTELVERLKRQEEQLSGNQQLREALEKTLISAQMQADQTRAQARTEAEQIVREAEYKARSVVEESYGELQRVQQALVQLKQLEEDFRSKFRSLLQGHLKVLAEEPLDIPAASEPVMSTPAAAPIPVAAPETVYAPEPAYVPEPQYLPEPQFVPQTAAENPFVLPDTFEAVPEYSSAPANVITQPVASFVPESIVAASDTVDTATVAAPVPEVESAALVDPVDAYAASTAAAPAPALWPDETADTRAHDAALEVPVFPTAEETNPAFLDSPTVVSDDSVTLIGEDPLQGFFFSSGEEAGTDAHPGARSPRQKPRDFEW